MSVLVFQILVVWIFFEPGLTDLVNTTKQLSPELGSRFVNIRTRLNLLFNNHSPLGMEHLSIVGQAAFCWSFIIFIARLYFAPDHLATGFFGALCAVFFGAAMGSQEAYMIFFFTAGLILLITSIEASFSMAYIDELTGLPGRRSLNETMLNLGRKYVIAMIDIDHFKSSTTPTAIKPATRS